MTGDEELATLPDQAPHRSTAGLETIAHDQPVRNQPGPNPSNTAPPNRRRLQLEPLTQDAFAPYGDVISARGEGRPINQGTALKFADLCTVELDSGAQAALHLYRAKPAHLPSAIEVIERHPLASQAFVPLAQVVFAVIVCGRDDQPKSQDLRAFLTDGRQGVQFATGVWHHPLLALESGDFLIVDRSCKNPQETESNLELLDVQHWGYELLRPSSGVRCPM